MKSTNEALAIQLNTSTRAALAARAGLIYEQLALLLGEDLGADHDPVVLDLVREAYVLLDAVGRPANVASVFNAFVQIRNAARLTRRLLWIWAELNGVERP
ncbi:hypothetical protein [Streptomyces sp. JW3]|uniref:hypothetical protein n=1 Tax=Streptomyces sp. JW3 TaxID=3456955 RepID=UPI003FA46A1A